MQLGSRFRIRSILAVAVLIAAPFAIFAVRGARPVPESPPDGHLNGPALINAAIFGQLPLAFEVNQGQAPESIHFIARAPRGDVFLAPSKNPATAPPFESKRLRSSFEHRPSRRSTDCLCVVQRPAA
jgi:hypothetical protein